MLIRIDISPKIHSHYFSIIALCRPMFALTNNIAHFRSSSMLIEQIITDPLRTLLSL